MKKLVLGILLCCAFASYSQNKPFKISGTLITEDDKQPLEAATVYLQRVKDSSLVTYTISDRNGKFLLEDKTTDRELNLFISYIGFQTYSQRIPINGQPIDLKNISLKTSANQLDEVIVKSNAPIVVKKDTVEFNLTSIKTKKNANLEDALKKVPGVEIDENGNITINGRPMSRILVNGKPFFGKDPTITTRNLTKDMIKKIQITDTKTKAQAFAGEDSNTDDKTINVILKEDKNKGVFGRLSGGAGTDERYEYAGMLNFFNDDQRLSVLSGGNNINSPGFSFGELQKMFGGGNISMWSVPGGAMTISIGGRSFGGGQGITTSRNLGANFADDIGKTVELSADYFYSSSNSDDVSRRQRENIIPDARYFTDASSKSVEDNESHSINLDLEIKPDSTWLIDIEPSFSRATNIRTLSNEDETRDEDNLVTNESTSNSFLDSEVFNFNNDLSVTKRFGSKGSFLRFRLDNEVGETNIDDYFTSETNIYGDNPENESRNQFTDGTLKQHELVSRLQYRIPIIGKEVFLDLNYTYRRNKQEDVKSTFNFNDVTQQFDMFDTRLSTNFKYLNTANIPEARFTYRTKKTTISFNGSYVSRTLANQDFLRPSLTLKRDFDAFEAYSRFRYKITPKSTISLSYSLDNNSPSLRQIQPFTDVTDPLNTVVGNPNLEPTNTHELYLNYNNFDFKSRSGYYFYLSGRSDRNRIVSNVMIDQNFIRTTTYTNVNGSRSLYGGGSFNKSIKLDTLRTLKFDTGFWMNYSKNVNFNNGLRYNSKNTRITPRLGITFDWKGVMEINPNYNISFSTNTFSTSRFENRSFVEHQAGLRTATFIPKNLEWRNDIRFSYNPEIADGFRKDAWMWNSTLAYSFLKDKATLTLKAYDLLNQNTNARRFASQTYIENRQSTVLQRYFMLSFSWKFNSLGKAGEVKDSGHFRFY